MRTLDRLLASLMFFTRLPFWRIRKVDAESFRHVVDYWPMAGWLTGGTMALTFWLAAQCFHIITAALIAVCARLLLTGALHEDGLADFFDGFGGGTTRERTLAIMKDSHIGTYGVVGLLMYTGLLISLLCTLPYAPAVIFAADIYAKACGSFLILQLPYARTAEQAKNGVVYSAWNGRSVIFHLLRCLIALSPALIWLHAAHPSPPYLAFLAPPAVEILLMLLMKRKLQGYTGDCCGAMFLLCELSFYAVAVAIL